MALTLYVSCSSLTLTWKKALSRYPLSKIGNIKPLFMRLVRVLELQHAARALLTGPAAVDGTPVARYLVEAHVTGRVRHCATRRHWTQSGLSTLQFTSSITSCACYNILKKSFFRRGVGPYCMFVIGLYFSTLIERIFNYLIIKFKKNNFLASQG